MAQKKKQATIHTVYEVCAAGEHQKVVRILRRYRRTGGYRRKDLKQILGDQTKGVSAGKEGLEELLSGK